MTVHPLPSAFPGLTVSRESADASPGGAVIEKPRCVLDRGLDRELYLVECYTAHRRATYFPEQFPHLMTFDFVADAILAGDIEDVASIHYFNPVEHFAKSPNEDIARAVADKARAEYRPISRKVLEFIEQHVSMTYARGLEVV